MEKIFVWCLLLFTEIFVPVLGQANAKKSPNAQLKVRDPCGPENEGICVLVDACPAAVSQIKQRRNHSLERCGWDRKMEIVCCMDELVKSRNPALRKSVEACMRYGQEVDILPFIINGFNASLGEYPHMAALGFNKSDDPNSVSWGDCGGALISENYVLTAAHCMFTADRKVPVMVRLGKIDLLGNDDGVEAQDIPVAENILNPDYDHLKKINDIALVRLSRPAVFSKNVQPICLYTEPDSPKGLVVTGWGVTQKDGNISRYLLQAPVAPVELSSCNETYLKSAVKKSILESQLCAISKEALPGDTCQGDSGGPIQVPNLKKNYGTQYIMVGVTSFGRGCATSTPSIYTRVYSYLKWIEERVW